MYWLGWCLSVIFFFLASVWNSSSRHRVKEQMYLAGQFWTHHPQLKGDNICAAFCSCLYIPAAGLIKQHTTLLALPYATFGFEALRFLKLDTWIDRPQSLFDSYLKNFTAKLDWLQCAGFTVGFLFSDHIYLLGLRRSKASTMKQPGQEWGFRKSDTSTVSIYDHAGVSKSKRAVMKNYWLAARGVRYAKS